MGFASRIIINGVPLEEYMRTTRVEMSTSVWKVKRFQARTLERNLQFYRVAKMSGLPMLPSCRFAGYATERERQGGNLYTAHFWLSCDRSEHRYAGGENGPNYESAGRRMLALQLEREVGVHRTNATLDGLLKSLADPTSAAEEWPIADALQEAGLDELSNLLTGLPVVKTDCVQCGGSGTLFSNENYCSSCDGCNGSGKLPPHCLICDSSPQDRKHPLSAGWGWCGRSACETVLVRILERHNLVPKDADPKADSVLPRPVNRSRRTIFLGSGAPRDTGELRRSL